jgi:hypothetical protein
MTFARAVFVGASVWGVVVLTPFYWLMDLTGRRYPAPIEYPHFFYGFFSVAMAWQVAFLVIGTNPARFRPMMIPAMLEKFGHVATVTVLYARSRIPVDDAIPAVTDLLLGGLFVIAFTKTRSRRPLQ